ncbi:MFS transporter, partial [Bradyrhizobium cajani]|nr:MFS transporter [Bradyrhizobium cajani]
MLLSRKPNPADRGGRVEQDDVAAALPAGLPAPSRQSLRGLDWFIFFLADV